MSLPPGVEEQVFEFAGLQIRQAVEDVAQILADRYDAIDSVVCCGTSTRDT